MSLFINTKQYLVNAILLLFLSMVWTKGYGGVSFNDLKPSGVNEVKWQELKTAVQESKILSRDGSSNLAFSGAMDPVLDRIVLGNIGSSDNGLSSGAASVFDYENGDWVEKIKLLPADGEYFQQFGYAVDLDGDWLAVGAPSTINKPGAVYLYQLVADQWQLLQKVVSSEVNLNNHFGSDINLIGEKLVVGDYVSNSTITNATGAVYVYEYDQNNSLWTLKQKIFADDAASGDGFGYKISLSENGTDLAVGSYCDDDLGSCSGSVYIFQEVAGVWQQVTKLNGSNTVANDYFGFTLSLENDWLAVGTFSNNESVYVFERLNDSWQQTDILISPTNSIGFGRHIDIAGNRMAISAINSGNVEMFIHDGSDWIPGETIFGVGSISSVGLNDDQFLAGNKYYEYLSDTHIPESMSCTITPCSWNLLANIESSETSEGDSFGVAVDVSGNRAVIGAYQDDDKGVNAGAAFIFEYTDLGLSFLDFQWRQIKKLTASDGDDGDAFGRSVAIDGDRVIVGSYLDDYMINVFPNVDAGSAYIYDFDGTFWVESEKLVAGESVPNVAGDLFGFSVDVVGDRVTIGAHKDDENGDDSGAVYVFDLTVNGWQKTEKIMPVNAQPGDGFGYALSLDNDQMLIGAYLDDEMSNDAGAAYVYKHSINSWEIEDKLLPIGGSSGDFFGTAVSLDGDRALVGAYLSSNNSFPLIEDTGKAYFFHKSDPIWVLSNFVVASDSALNDRFGYAVSIEGDRALIGSWFDDDNGSNSGSAYVFDYNDSTSLWTETEKLTADDGADDDYFGVALSITDDWMLIGAHRVDTPKPNSGAVYVFVEDVIFKNSFEPLSGGVR